MLLTQLQKFAVGGIALLLILALLYFWVSKTREEEARLQTAAKIEMRKKAAAEFQARESQRMVREAEERAREEQRRLDDKREELQGVLDRAVFDPYAIRLRDVRLVQGNGGYALCGYVSAKMPSGKYFSERPFSVTEFPLEKVPSQVIGVSKTGEIPDPTITTAQLLSAGC